MDNVIFDLLTGTDPARARNFIMSWGERRNASWIDAARQAEAKAASGAHLPHARGQYRYILGETALGEAARAVGAGALPFTSNPPGGVFMIARVGRLAIMSLTVSWKKATPRRSITRKMLAEPNQDLDPQPGLPLAERLPRRAATELAYLGCVVAVPDRRDPTAPAELAFAVPNASLTDWVVWVPLPKAHMLLQERCDAAAAGAKHPQGRQSAAIADNVIPIFRVPKHGEGGNDDGNDA